MSAIKCLLPVLALLVLGCAEFNQAGRDIKEGATEIGHGTRDAAREAAPAAKSVVRDIGSGFKQLGKDIGDTAKSAAQEAHKAVKDDEND